MQSIPLRNAPSSILSQVQALNRQDETVLSPLDAPALDRLIASAARATALVEDDRVAAFLIGHDDASLYWGTHFQWFRARYPRFGYIDRVVVAAQARGRGLASQLYDGFADHCRATAIPLLTCEISRDPPNPGSEIFHARQGFAEVGRSGAGVKPVLYMARSLDFASPLPQA